MGTPRNQSVQKAFALLHSFYGPDEWVTNAELSRRAKLSEASAHRLMRTLEEIGAVVRDPKGCYRPGMVLASLSKDIEIGDLVRVTSSEILVDLAARLKGIIHIGVLEHGMVTYRAKIGDPICVPIPSKVGAQQEAYCSALGKALLAGLAEEQLDQFLYDGELIALTPQTITSVSRLRAEIEIIRERGYVVDDREAFQSICCIGVPIRDARGLTVAALSLADTSEHMGVSWQDEVSHALIDAAAAITLKMCPAREKRAKVLEARTQ